MRTVGIEEELLLVSRETGRPLSVAGRLLSRAQEHGVPVDPDGAPQPGPRPGGMLEAELQQQMLETDTQPREDMAVLSDDLRAWRLAAITAAREVGSRVVAVGTSPMPVVPQMVSTPRYQQIAERFGLTSAEQLTCGCHVHVSVESDDEAVGVLDRIRVWLPPLLAISTNSPFWQGQDTRYASFRSQALTRWPSAGPVDIFGSAQAYRRLVSDMVASGVLLDEGMVYFDARASHRYPTVEIRVADVCLHTEDAILVAALCRGLVETAARQWTVGTDPPAVPTAMLRLATWQSGRDGLGGDLLDPTTCRPRPAAEVLAGLVEHVRPALRDTADEALVDKGIEQVLARGNGAQRQRATLARTGDLVDVVADLARATAGQED